MGAKKFIDFIGTRGVGTGSKLENFFLFWLNWVCLLTALGAFLIFLATFYYESDQTIWFYRFITLLVACLYLMVVVFNHFDKIQIAFFHFAVFIPWWYAIAIAVIGGNFSQSIAAASTLVVILFIYPKRDKVFFGLIIYNILLFVFPTLYVNIYGPIIGINIPYDEIVVFLLCCGWVSIAFVAFDRSRANLIKNLELKNETLNSRTNELQQFSYLMAHDIKTPVRNIVSFLGLLERSLSSNNIDKAKEHLQFAIKGSKDLNSLIADVSKVIELRAEDEDQNRELLQLDKLMEEVVFAHNDKIKEYEGVVSYDDLGQYFCNATDMKLLFQNLVINGLKYNQADTPSIEVQSTIEANKKLITFKDNGIGIDVKYQDKIFNFFERLHVKSEYEGTGIGLGICKYIVGKYTGTIRVESIVGQGSTFIIELPR